MYPWVSLRVIFILTSVREYRLVVRVIENVVPVAQREFLQVRNFGLVNDVLKKEKTNYVLHAHLDASIELRASTRMTYFSSF